MSLASLLKERARMLAAARAFFAERNLLEIDCGALMARAPIDANIECIRTDEKNSFLHTSPEYALKKFLSQGVGDCYFLGHVYRKGEIGPLHNPEFTMVEWYRRHISFSQMIEETCEFLFLFFGSLPIRYLSYREAFSSYLGIDYTAISLSKLQHLTKSTWDRTSCIHYLLSHQIEPRLGQNELTVLTDFPPHEAALACTSYKNNELIAERYEIYHQGIELTNGYHELSDAKELKRRFAEINRARAQEGKDPYLIDEGFLSSLANLPDCCGVAVGFDRALMLKHKLNTIHEIIPYTI